jgi:hypothetical protein
MKLVYCNAKGNFHRFAFILAMVLVCVSGVGVLFAQPAVSIPEEIEWTWEVRPLHPNPKLPNVLLLGDSITRNYFPEVEKKLTGIANTYLMASSTSVGDPRLARQITEFAAMEHVHFQIVHFNNGMHGWDYTEAQYKAAFPNFLLSVTKLVQNHKGLVWATTTPVTSNASSVATNFRVDQRNTIANAFVRSANIAMDDQHALMMQHQDLHQDPVHFNAKGSAMQGDQAAEIIKRALTNVHGS